MLRPNERGRLVVTLPPWWVTVAFVCAALALLGFVDVQDRRPRRRSARRGRCRPSWKFRGSVRYGEPYDRHARQPDNRLRHRSCRSPRRRANCCCGTGSAVICGSTSFMGGRRGKAPQRPRERRWWMLSMLWGAGACSASTTRWRQHLHGATWTLRQRSSARLIWYGE